MLWRTFLKIFAFMLIVVGTFAYVGQLVPQFEEHPPKKTVITSQTGREELVLIGQELVRGKGGCLICHKDSETENTRGPDLRQAAGQAPTRKPDMNGEAYLLEALREPELFLVPGYPKMMPSALKPPANLTPAEIKAVTAYLQSLGGVEVTVRVTDEDVIQSQRTTKAVHRGRALMDQHGCTNCHKVEGEGGDLAPDLTRVAEKHPPQALLNKLNDSTVWTAPGFERGVMPNFAEMPEGERQEIVAYLAGLAGIAYSATGATAPWSHEGARLGLVVLLFNGIMLLAWIVSKRWKCREVA